MKHLIYTSLISLSLFTACDDSVSSDSNSGDATQKVQNIKAKMTMPSLESMTSYDEELIQISNYEFDENGCLTIDANSTESAEGEQGVDGYTKESHAISANSNGDSKTCINDLGAFVHMKLTSEIVSQHNGIETITNFSAEYSEVNAKQMISLNGYITDNGEILQKSNIEGEMLITSAGDIEGQIDVEIIFYEGEYSCDFTMDFVNLDEIPKCQLKDAAGHLVE